MNNKELEVDEIEQDFLNKEQEFLDSWNKHEEQYLNSFADE